MGLRILNTLLRLTIVTALAVAFGGLGFAHKHSPAADPQLLAFLQAGGTLADICDDTEPQHHLTPRQCDACRLADHSADVGLTCRALVQPNTRPMELDYDQRALVLSHPAARSDQARAPPVDLYLT